MDISYYETTDAKYDEYGIIMEDCNAGSMAKVYIPILMPCISHTSLMNVSFNRENASNIINASGREALDGYTETNYIEIKAPKYLGDFKKNDKVILTFIGGEINRPMIIGREDGE